jgi:thiol-disulfide isomerase/thioredoxin
MKLSAVALNKTSAKLIYIPMKRITIKTIPVLLFLSAIAVILTSFTAAYNHEVKKSLKSNINLKGKFKFKSADSICLVTWDEFPTLLKRMFYQTHQQTLPISKTGEFGFSFNSSKPVYFSLIQKKGNTQDEFLSLYLVQPGDQIFMQISNQTAHIDTIAFDGKGSEKFNCKYQLSKQIKNSIKAWKELTEKQQFKQNGILEQLKQTANRADYIYRPSKILLESYRKLISKKVYDLMEADLTGDTYDLFYKTAKIYAAALRNMNADSLKQLGKITEQVSIQMNLKNNSELNASAQYNSCMLRKLAFESAFFNKTVFILITLLNDPKLKERLVTEYFLDQYNRIPNVENTLDSASLLVNNTYYKTLLNRLKTAKLQNIFDNKFQLTDAAGKTIQLSVFRGKVVFIDFWFTGCGGCSLYYMNILSKVEHAFKDNNDVVFISVSIDKDKALWLNSLRSGKYTSPNVVNLYTNGTGTDHPLIRQLKVNSYPRPIIFSKEGTTFLDSHTALRTSVAEVSTKINEALQTKPSPINVQKNLSE